VKNPTFLQKHVSMTLLEVSLSMPSLPPHGLWGRSQVSLFFALKGGNKNSPAVVISNIKLFLLFLCNHIYKKEPKKWVKFWNFAYMEVYTYSILIIYPISMAFFSWIDDVESYFKWFPLSLMISEFNVKGPKSANFPNFNVFFYRIQF
jgi:hypothetical protein